MEVRKAYVRENPSQWPYKAQFLHFRYLKLLVIIYLEPQKTLFFEGQPPPDGGLNSKYQPLKINMFEPKKVLVSDVFPGGGFKYFTHIWGRFSF